VASLRRIVQRSLQNLAELYEDYPATLGASGFPPSLSEESMTSSCRVHGPRVIQNARPSLPSELVAKLLSLTATPSQYRLVYLGLYAGLRVSESASITEQSWQDDRPRFMGKGRHPELVRMRGRVLLRSTSAGCLQASCQDVSKRLGHKSSTHTLRRTFAVALVEANVSRDILGALCAPCGCGATGAERASTSAMKTRGSS
jgi:hypothetical protein